MLEYLLEYLRLFVFFDKSKGGFIHISTTFCCHLEEPTHQRFHFCCNLSSNFKVKIKTTGTH